MKSIRISLYTCVFSLFFFSCKEEENIPPETWQFTKLVNVSLDNNGYMITLDFYQKKGNQWRIVRMSPDDHTIFYLDDTISINPFSYTLPIDNTNAFMTCNVRLFNPQGNQVYNQGTVRWFMGDPVQFQVFNTFQYEFPDMPAAYNSISKFSAATYSLEKAYDNNDKINTYIFYDFPNQKYVYYGVRSGTDLILENTLPNLCTKCNLIDWKNVDAATCTNEKNTGSIYYFFDFDAKKVYILFRNNKDTNNPSFVFDTGLTLDFSEAFHNKYGTPEQNEAFDFSK